MKYPQALARLARHDATQMIAIGVLCVYLFWLFGATVDKLENAATTAGAFAWLAVSIFAGISAIVSVFLTVTCAAILIGLVDRK